MKLPTELQRVIGLSLGLLTAATAYGQSIVNGSFEAPFIGNPGISGLPVPGWVGSGSTAYIFNPPGSPVLPDGAQYLVLPELSDTASQTVLGLTPGSEYNVSFWSFGEGFAAVGADGIGFADSAWTQHVLHFVASASAVVLSFSGSATPGEGALDMVSLSAVPVPEPEAGAMLLAGLTMLGWVSMRRRRGASTK